MVDGPLQEATKTQTYSLVQNEHNWEEDQTGLQFCSLETTTFP